MDCNVKVRRICLQLVLVTKIISQCEADLTVKGDSLLCVCLSLSNRTPQVQFRDLTIFLYTFFLLVYAHPVGQPFNCNLNRGWFEEAHRNPLYTPEHLRIFFFRVYQEDFDAVCKHP